MVQCGMATLEKSELDIALERLTPQWLAGFFDGEGSISVVRHRGMPALAVNITQCDLNTLAIIGMKYGAGREPIKKPRRKETYSSAWVLQFGGKSALPLLEAIQPYVILKRKLVNWGIEMAKLHGKSGGNRRNIKGKMDPAVRARREELLAHIHAENQSGRPKKLRGSTEPSVQ
jgi:hypothetical protein